MLLVLLLLHDTAVVVRIRVAGICGGIVTDAMLVHIMGSQFIAGLAEETTLVALFG